MKRRITTYVMGGFFLCTFLICLIKPDEKISVSERRPLKNSPEITLSKIQSGRFMSEWEDYVLDQFPLRDGFRTVKAWMEQFIFAKKNNNDIYVENGYAAEMVYPLNESSVENAAKVFRSIYETYLEQKAANVYFSMIPDKNYFLADETGQVTISYADFLNQMRENTSYMNYIDIISFLSIEDYYRTDSHWKQEQIIDVASHLASSMGTSVAEKYNIHELERPFSGVYSSRWALPLKKDSIKYLTNDLIDQFIVYDYENEKVIPVYDMEKADGNDMYEMYLGGSLSLISIENPQVNTKKELVLFRDSFGSSIAPILAQGYSKVTLIDVRYIPWQRLEQFVDFEGKDVLFLYSTALLNHNEIR